MREVWIGAMLDAIPYDQWEEMIEQAEAALEDEVRNTPRSNREIAEAVLRRALSAEEDE